MTEKQESSESGAVKAEEAQAAEGKTVKKEKSKRSSKKGKTKVFIYPDWCKGCGICVAFCPSKVLEMSAEGKAQVVREEDCINCGFCELHCPDFAIVVKSKNGEEEKGQ